MTATGISEVLDGIGTFLTIQFCVQWGTGLTKKASLAHLFIVCDGVPTEVLFKHPLLKGNVTYGTIQMGGLRARGSLTQKKDPTGASGTGGYGEPTALFNLHTPPVR